jgi:hypothetical protein
MVSARADNGPDRTRAANLSRVRTPRVLRGLVVAAALPAALAVALTGCGAGSVPDVPTTSSPSPTPTVSRPADGVSLSALGFENGPVDRVFVPVGAQVSSRVDQTNNVTVVMTSPSATDLVAFYRRTAVGNGFAVTGDDAATTTLTFAGFGWTGTFTGDQQASALLLRPAS